MYVTKHCFFLFLFHRIAFFHFKTFKHLPIFESIYENHLSSLCYSNEAMFCKPHYGSWDQFDLQLVVYKLKK